MGMLMFLLLHKSSNKAQRLDHRSLVSLLMSAQIVKHDTVIKAQRRDLSTADQDAALIPDDPQLYSAQFLL